MARIETTIRLRAGLSRVNIDMTIWRDREGNAIVALEPKNMSSQEFLVREGEVLNAKIAENFSLKKTYTYERDQDGYFVPQEGSPTVARGVPLTSFELDEVGSKLASGQEVSQWPNKSQAPVSDLITLDVGSDIVGIRMRLWKGPDKQGFVALEPDGDKARITMIANREPMRQRIATAHGLESVVVYEGQENGLYTPSNPDHALQHGASVNEEELERMGDFVEHQGWQQAMNMAENRMPPPAPDVEWPSGQ